MMFDQNQKTEQNMDNRWAGQGYFYFFSFIRPPC